MQSVDQLVERVKQIQRTSPDVKERWRAFCDLKNGGKFDPGRASAETLQAFLDSEERGGADFSNVSEFEQLLVKVKAGQRTDVAFKEAWSQYCEQHMQGVRDPCRHTEESLRTFLSMTGSTGLKPGMGGHDALMGNAAGLGKGGCMPPPGLGMDMGMGVGKGQGGSACCGGKGMACGSWDDQMNHMWQMMQGQMGGAAGGSCGAGRAGAEAVKFGQRHSENFKAAWTWYSNFKGNGKRDPNLHDDAFIAGFLDAIAGAAMEGMPADPQGPASKRGRIS